MAVSLMDLHNKNHPSIVVENLCPVADAFELMESRYLRVGFFNSYDNLSMSDKAKQYSFNEGSQLRSFKLPEYSLFVSTQIIMVREKMICLIHYNHEFNDYFSYSFLEDKCVFHEGVSTKLLISVTRIDGGMTATLDIIDNKGNMVYTVNLVASFELFNLDFIENIKDLKLDDLPRSDKSKNWIYWKESKINQFRVWEKFPLCFFKSNMAVFGREYHSRSNIHIRSFITNMENSLNNMKGNDFIKAVNYQGCSKCQLLGLDSITKKVDLQSQIMDLRSTLMRHQSIASSANSSDGEIFKKNFCECPLSDEFLKVLLDLHGKSTFKKEIRHQIDMVMSNELFNISCSVNHNKFADILKNIDYTSIKVAEINNINKLYCMIFSK